MKVFVIQDNVIYKQDNLSGHGRVIRVGAGRNGPISRTNLKGIVRMKASRNVYAVSRRIADFDLCSRGNSAGCCFQGAPKSQAAFQAVHIIPSIAIRPLVLFIHGIHNPCARQR
jgi:hypothetical protein